MRRFLLLFLFTSALWAQPQRGRQHTVVCFGDSITAGYGAPQGSAYPDFLRADLIAHGLYPKIINQGVNGDTTKGGLLRLHEVLAAHPDVVILELGGNDALRGVPLATIKAQLAACIKTLREAHIQVLLVGMTLPPNYGPDYIHQFTSMYPDLARTYHLTLVPLPVNDVFNVPDRMTGDGIHPNSAGYQVMAQDYLPYVLPLVSRD